MRENKPQASINHANLQISLVVHIAITGSLSEKHNVDMYVWKGLSGSNKAQT